MTPTRKKRLVLVGLLVIGIGAAAAVAITALQSNMFFFITPTDVHAQTMPPDRQFRLGGLVMAGTVERDPHSLAVSFTVTDGAYELPVTFNGILPDLFREGQGVIAHGRLGEDGQFHAHEVLARHDETYMPAELARALERTGHPMEANIQPGPTARQRD